MMLMALLSSFLGVAIAHTHPLWHTAHRTQVLNTFFFIDVVFLFAHDPLHPVPSCYFDLRFEIQYLFSPSPNMILWHSSVSPRKEPDLFSKHCAQTLQRKKKKAMVVTYVFQTSGLKAKKKKTTKTTVFLPMFSDRRHDKARLKSELSVSCMATCVSVSPSKAWGGGFTPVVSLLHAKHSSPSSLYPASCLLPPPPLPLPLSLKSKTKLPHSLPS